MRITTSKSKNAESFYISKGFINDKGGSTSVIVRKLGTLKDLLLARILKMLFVRCASHLVGRADGKNDF